MSDNVDEIILTPPDVEAAIASILADAPYTLDEFREIAALDGGHGDEFPDSRSRSQWSWLRFLLGEDES